MRILLLAHRYPPEGPGGVETWTRTLARALAEGGHVAVVGARVERSDAPPFSRWESRDEGPWGSIAVHRLVHHLNDARSFTETWDDRRFDAPLKTLVDAVRPDVVHLAHPDGWGRRPADIARAVGVPLVVTLHDYAWICGRGQMVRPPGVPCARVEESRCARCLDDQISAGPGRGLIRALAGRLPVAEALARRDRRPIDTRRFPSTRAARRWRTRRDAYLDVLESAAAVTSPSNFVATRHQAAGLRRDVTVIRQGMNGSPPPAADRVPGPLRVGWFGNPIPTKGLELLLDAVAAVPPGAVELHVHGASPRHDPGDGRLDARPGVIAHGRYSPEEATTRMASVDLVAVPSRWDENAPMVALEARWAGRPLIVTNRGGLPELVRNDGWVLPEDPERWAEQLAFLASRPQATAEAARNAPPPRDAAAMCDEYLATYAEVT